MSVEKLKSIQNKMMRKLYCNKVQMMNKNHDFTIIAQNCIGGVIYNNLGLEFKSPTINMFIEDENFIKLVGNLEHYLQVEPQPVTDCFIDPIDSDISYPKICVDDVEICCLHYKDCNEAIEAWEKRCKRVNFENIYVIGNSWNMHSKKELVEELLRVSKYKTVVFTTEKYQDERCIQLPGTVWNLDERGIVRPNITDEIPGSYMKYFETFFDYISWINA
jgi:uncharacterized protein (DUF1919 family)